MTVKSCLKFDHEDDCTCSVGRKSGGDVLSVSFRSIDIHEFSMELGDNPACGTGVPVQIGWEPHTFDTMDIDIYERQRIKNKKKDDLLIPAEQRRRIVTSTGTPMEEIVSVVQQSLQIKADRKNSIKNMKWDQWEFKMEKLKRIMKKLRNNSKKTPQPSRSTLVSMSA